MVLLFGAFTFLLVIGAPIIVSLLLSSLLYINVYMPESALLAAQRVVSGVDSFTLLAIPFFVLAGVAMNKSGISEKIFDFARALVGHIPGGLGHVNVLSSMIFAGMSGSATADAAGIGLVAIEAMKREGYSKEYSCAVTVASSVIGPIIPPSISMIIYSVASGTSVGGLFMAGAVPGVLMGIFLMFMCYYQASKNNFPVHPRANIGEVWESFKSTALALFMPVIIIVGIGAGIFTATEAGAVAAFYSLFLGIVVHRKISFSDLEEIFFDSAKTTANIVLLLGTVQITSYIFSRKQIPLKFMEFITEIAPGPISFLILLNIFLVFLGMFMPSSAAIVILVPVLLPAASALGIAPLHLGIIVVLNLILGNLTPPIGLTSFVVAEVGNIDPLDLFRAVIPYFIPLLILLLLIIIFPQIALWLPGVLGYL